MGAGAPVEFNDEDVRAACRAGVARPAEFEGLRYVRFHDDAHRTDRGTVLVGGRMVPTYPHIGRIFALEQGVRRTFRGLFRAEEKIDGYNVRIVRVSGRLLAFSRGGYVCPFTTDRLTDLVQLDPLFDEDPDLVVCAEVAGPGSPYLHGQVPHVHEDVALFVFDLMRFGHAGFLSLPERDRLLEHHRVPRAPDFGDLQPGDIGALRELVLQLDAQGSEGLVLKPHDEGRRVKYVTPSVNLADIVEDSSLLAELPGEFFQSRIVRLAIGLEELGLQERAHAMAERLGRALLEDFERTLRDFERTGVVSQVFRIRMHDETRADEFLRHMGHASGRVNVKEIGRARRGDFVEITFEKQFQRSTGWLHTVLRGESVVD